MIKVDVFTFNPFQENTYVLHDETKECILFDPGCYEPEEKKELTDFIRSQGLKPVRLINTHCHIDHVLGNNYVAETWSLSLEMNKLELPVLNAVKEYGSMWGVFSEPQPESKKFLTEGNIVEFGKSKLEILFTPGHSPGSLSFYSREDNFVIAGDVLFLMSIGRTDLPGGNFDTLIASIKEKLFPLGDEVKVYPGHGPATTVGFEKSNNPFLGGGN
jgi:glyoxylase-like metal-dependent hydrolase (beta-lactamase superfamily II)